MSGPVCPSCGVAVVPGYVRCPKCHKPLPRRQSTVVEGGTSVEGDRSKLPMIAIIGVALAGVILIAYLGLRRSDHKTTAVPVATPTETPDQPTPTETPDQPTAAETPTQPNRPDPGAAADSLERNLKRQRLWSTVSVEGSRVDVRSSSCADPQMGRMLDGAIASFKAAGLTKLRCLEQSGAVVTDRDL